MVLGAMRQHVKVSRVQECGCGAIANLACNNDTNRVGIAIAGGIPVIEEVMRQHANISGVQDRGCDAIGKLAQNNEANYVSTAKGWRHFS